MFLRSQRASGQATELGGDVLPLFSLTFQDVCSLLSRTCSNISSRLEEREAELELLKLEKKDEPREAAPSERWHHFL